MGLITFITGIVLIIVALIIGFFKSIIKFFGSTQGISVLIVWSLVATALLMYLVIYYFLKVDFKPLLYLLSCIAVGIVEGIVISKLLKKNKKL